MIYLASPYSSSNTEMQLRFELAEQCTAALMQQDLAIFSPIVHCHELAAKYHLPTDAAYWEKYNMQFLRKAECLYVLKIEGWDESRGVAQEIAMAKSLYLPIHYVDERGVMVL